MLDLFVAFTVVTAALEIGIFAGLSDRTRLRILGSKRALVCIHVTFILANLIVGWGTVSGTATAKAAGVVSLIVTPLLRRYYGHIYTNDAGREIYVVGRKHYDPATLT